MAWVYIESEKGLWTVGFYAPDGEWRSETDHSDKEAAARRCAMLNGGGLNTAPKKRLPAASSAKFKIDVDPDFVRFKKCYPKRAGAQRWPDAQRFWNALIKQGVDSEEIIAGALRYREMLVLTGKEGTEYVQQAASFLGRNQGWKEDWGVPVVQPQTQRARMESEQDKFERIAGATSKREWAST
jgi:hypothetical protein